MGWKWVLTLIILLFLIIFATQNYGVVHVRFMVWSFATSKAILIFASFVVGAIFGWTMTYMKKKERKRNQQNQATTGNNRN